MEKSPDSSLPALMGSESELEAAYRFFNHDAVTPARILWPHFEATVARARAAREVLIIHDTSTMQYGGSRKGLGSLSGRNRGYLAHVSLAVGVASALPLGVLNPELVTRKDRSEQKRALRRKRIKRRRFDDDNERNR